MQISTRCYLCKSYQKGSFCVKLKFVKICSVLNTFVNLKMLPMLPVLPVSIPVSVLDFKTYAKYAMFLLCLFAAY